MMKAAALQGGGFAARRAVIKRAGGRNCFYDSGVEETSGKST